MKKSTGILLIAMVSAIAVVFCVLFVSGSIRNEQQIEALKSSSSDQALQISELDADVTETFACAA